MDISTSPAERINELEQDWRPHLQALPREQQGIVSQLFMMAHAQEAFVSGHPKPDGIQVQLLNVLVATLERLQDIQVQVSKNQTTIASWENEGGAPRQGRDPNAASPSPSSR